jgi:hypothetical protein
MRRWRKMTWVLWAWCILIVVWAIAGGSSAAHKSAAECAHPGLLTKKACSHSPQPPDRLRLSPILSPTPPSGGSA